MAVRSRVVAEGSGQATWQLETYGTEGTRGWQHAMTLVVSCLRTQRIDLLELDPDLHGSRESAAVSSGGADQWLATAARVVASGASLAAPGHALVDTGVVDTQSLRPG
jgi:hypothetical protein